MDKRKAFEIVSQFIYDSSMDIERKFKCQEAANHLYNNNKINIKISKNIILRLKFLKHFIYKGD